MSEQGQAISRHLFPHLTAKAIAATIDRMKR